MLLDVALCVGMPLPHAFWCDLQHFWADLWEEEGLLQV